MNETTNQSSFHAFCSQESHEKAQTAQKAVGNANPFFASSPHEEEKANNPTESSCQTETESLVRQLPPNIQYSRRQDDEEFNNLLTSYEANCCKLTQISRLASPLDDFELVISFTTHHKSGRAFVPSGPCSATRLSTNNYGPTAIASFPHILAKDWEGGHLWIAETLKNTSVPVCLRHKRHTEHVTEQHVLDAFNTTLPPGEERLKRLELQLRLKFADFDEEGLRRVPCGVGDKKTFQKPLSDGYFPPMTQLLRPPEFARNGSLTPNYKKQMLNGKCRFNFQFQGSCTSNLANPKGAACVVEVTPSDHRLAHLTAYSTAFIVVSKFRSQA